MRRRNILKSAGALTAGGLALGTVGGKSVETTIENADQEELNLVLQSDTVEQLRADFGNISLQTETASHKSVKIKRESGEDTNWSVLTIPSNIGDIEILLSNGILISLQVEPNRTGKSLINQGNKFTIPDCSVEVYYSAVGAESELIRGLTEEERERITEIIGAQSGDVTAFTTSLQETYTVVEEEKQTNKNMSEETTILEVIYDIDKEKMEVVAERERYVEATPNGREVDVQWYERYDEVHQTNGTYSHPPVTPCGADDSRITPDCGGGGGGGGDCDHEVDIGPIDRCVDLPDGAAEKVTYCVANSTLCIVGIDTCFLAKIPCSASKIPGNPSFAGFVAACFIALTNLCGKELIQVLLTSHSCEVVVACLWEFGESLPI